MIDLRKLDSTAARTWERGLHNKGIQYLEVDGVILATVEDNGRGGFSVFDHVHDVEKDECFDTLEEAKESAEKNLEKQFAEIKA